MKHLHIAYTMLIAVNSSELQTILPAKLINYEMPNLNLNNRRKNFYTKATKLRTRPWLQFTIEIEKDCLRRGQTTTRMLKCVLPKALYWDFFYLNQLFAVVAVYVVHSFTTETHSRDEQPENKLRKPQKEAFQ